MSPASRTPTAVHAHAQFTRWLAGAGLAAVLCTALATALPSAIADATARPPAAPTQSSNVSQSAPVRAVRTIDITVSNLDRSVDFYQSVLDFKEVGRSESAGEDIEHLTGVFGCRILTALMTLGTEQIQLRQFLAPEGRPIPPDSRSNDHWFQHIAIVVSDLDRAYAHLRGHHVRHASSGPQTLPKTIPGAAGIGAFYFKDPDGHALEIIHFPDGKGDPRWQAPTDRLFLGIDHTAITVASTEASLRFYRDTLAMHIAGESENFGVEQEHLNNVFGARLRITALRAGEGPGIELLEYLAPSDGRPYPTDTRSNDLWNWQTQLESTDVNALAARLRDAGATWVSSGIVESAPGGPAITVRDPDGHAVVVCRAGSQHVPPASGESADDHRHHKSEGDSR